MRRIKLRYQLPELIIFDLDNTLYRYDLCNKRALKAVSRLASSEYGVPARRFLLEYESSRLIVKSRISGASSHNRLLYFSEWISRFESKLDFDVAAIFNDVYWATYLSEMKLSEGVVDLLRKIRHRGIQACLVTDQMSDIQFRKLRVLKIEKYFDHIVTSEECAGEKSSLEPFRLIFSRIQRKEFDCIWFIGDEMQDWPIDVPGNEKVFFASPFARNVPKGVTRIQNYKDVCKLI